MLSWVSLVLFFKLAVIVARRLGMANIEVEIPFYPFRFSLKKIKNRNYN